jgi:phage-related protein
MAISSAEKMRRYRAKLKRHGLVQVQGWTSPEKAKVINCILETEHTFDELNSIRRQWEIQLATTNHTILELQSIRERWEKLVLGREKKTRWEKATLLLKELGQVLDKSFKD